jgi:putative ABC transport system permease protein
MVMLNKLRLRLRALFFKSKMEHELEEEVRFHLEREIQENIARGMSLEEARFAALRSFGGVERVKEESRDERGIRLFDEVRQDMRYGARMLSKKPGFTLVATITLALGIGANTAVFSLMDGVLFKPMPGIAELDRVVQIGWTDNGQGFSYSSSYADYQDYRDQTTTFTGISAECDHFFNLGTDRIAKRIKGTLVSGNYFEVLGVKSIQGRLLQPSDAEVEGEHPVAVISERLWRDSFDAEPNVVGKTVSLNSYSYTIVGVAADFKGTRIMYEATDVWIPVTMWRYANPSNMKNSANILSTRGYDFLKLLGRLKPGVTMEQAQADMSIIAQRLGQAHYGASTRGARVIPNYFGLSTGDRKELGVFFGIQFAIAGIIMLIVCANVAGLTLSLTIARQKEIGVRLALGAGRWRVVRQLLTESIMLGALGGIFAMLVAFWLTNWIRAGAPYEQSDMTQQLAFTADWRVLSFTFGLSIITGLLFGLAPALQSSKLDLNQVMKDSGNSFGRGSNRRARLRSTLVVVQISLSLILLVSAGLFIRTLQNVQALSLGFTTENLLTAKVDLSLQNYSEAQGYQFYKQLIERIKGLPGVQGASLAAIVPLQRKGIGGSVVVNKQPQFYSSLNIITPGYLDTMGIQLLLGRGINEHDVVQSPRVAIINETFARNAWPSDNPIGKIFNWKDRAGDYPVEVVGVVRDVKGRNLTEPTPNTVFFPLAQKYNGMMTLHVRTPMKPELLISSVQQEIRVLDPKLPMYDIQTLEQYLSDALWKKRFLSSLIGGCGLLALVLANLGLYGILSYNVVQRTQEIGIRMALGARTNDVLREVIGQGIKLISIGITLGLVGTFATTQVLKSFLFGVTATDPLTFILISLLLASVALLACYLPARRATKVDPMVALKCE